MSEPRMSEPRMSRMVALLRGVNVGGHNRVKMPELRALVESLGHRDVTTYLQSGNVVFTATGPVKDEVLELEIASAFGIEVDVMLRTGDDLERVLAGNPFGDVDPTTLHVGFVGAVPPAGALGDVDATRFVPERFNLACREIYLHLPQGMARAKLPAQLGRRLGGPVTMRNWRTVAALADLTGA